MEGEESAAAEASTRSQCIQERQVGEEGEGASGSNMMIYAEQVSEDQEEWHGKCDK